MTLVQRALGRAALKTFDASPAATRQPITVAMRVGHRLAAHATMRPFVLRNVAPIVSFTFDDVPESAATTAAAILETAGARGTFFVSTGAFGERTLDWRLAEADAVARLAAAGHEVGLHTHAHKPLAETTPRALAADLRLCAATLRALAPGVLSANFAYPYGFAHPIHARVLGGAVRSARTTHPGVNAGRVDLLFLRSWALGATLAEPARLDRLLDEAAAAGGWLILTGHDVADRPSPYGCTPHLLEHALAGAAARGIAVLPVEGALDRCGVPPFAA